MPLAKSLLPEHQCQAIDACEIESYGQYILEHTQRFPGRLPLTSDEFFHNIFQKAPVYIVYGCPS